MKTDYFRCQACGVVKELAFDKEIPAQTADEDCQACEGRVPWDRMWSPPSLGRGSSGEPPR